MLFTTKNSRNKCVLTSEHLLQNPALLSNTSVMHRFTYSKANVLVQNHLSHKNKDNACTVFIVCARLALILPHGSLVETSGAPTGH